MNRIKRVVCCLTVMVAIVNCMAGVGNEAAKKSFAVTPFTKIATQGVADIEFVQTATTSVEAQGLKEFVDGLEVECKAGVLYIKTHKSKKDKRFRHRPLVIRIASPKLEALTLKGVGDFEAPGKVQADKFAINSSGVGDVELGDLHCTHLAVDCSSVGDVELKGKTTTAHYDVSGVGDVEARYMQAVDVTVDHTAVGDLECHASGTIAIKSTGVGDVHYYGHPNVTSLKAKGVGEVRSK